jgi:ankyrin repeat protein
MKPQSILLLIGYALAGSHIITPPPALMSSSKVRIELADIEALIKSDNANELKSIIDLNTQILKNPVSKTYRNEAFKLALNQNRASVIALFLKELDVNAAFNENLAIESASLHGYTDIVRMLLQRPEVDPAADFNGAIRAASTLGHTEIVRMLLERPEVNPAAQNNEAIVVASARGYTEIVQLLLQRSDVNPGARDNNALINAVKYGRTKVIKLLLEDSRVDPSVQSNLAFRFAVHTERADFVKLLLADDRVNPADLNNAAILKLNLGLGPSFNHRYDILKLLLEDGRADPSVNNNEILTKFRSGESLPTIELLENDDRVKAIEFLNSEVNHLTLINFLNLLNSKLKWGTASYIETVFGNNLITTFISELLEISLPDAKAIKNLDDFDKYIYKMHKDVLNHRISQEAVSKLETTLLQRKFEFLWRYYGGTLGYKDHFSRFQELTVSLGKNH